ncbi:MAG TPA: class II aldolase/adducin family protein [Opitutaceae bacterium]|nr:class II aldolase/adducin family protein [Opitutaceae bacterium]HND62328.1 class II aldolase/adducin family protein [Opitutaceae bacterium]
MANVITAREAEELLRKGEQPPAGSILTPSARDVFSGRSQPAFRSPAATASGSPAKSGAPSTPDLEYKWAPGSDPKTPAEIERFFRSPAIEVLKERICDIGRRLWTRDYTDGNGGNITIRVGDNLALCTPTLICKGFMKPEDMCLVDLDGKQLAGTRVRTSEALTHFGIMKRQPAAKACVHAHPPHATAFAIANVDIPSCLIPEAEVFLGKIGVAKYQTPGTPANAAEVGEVGKVHQAVLMQNHGVIVWGKDVEDAYWKMENIDSYCRTIWIAAGLGSGLHRFTGGHAKELIALRQKLGMPDPRANLKECELCDSADFRPATVCAAPAAAEASAPADPQVEALVQQITEQILKAIAAK